MASYIRSGAMLLTLCVLILSACSKTVEIEQKVELLDFLSLDDIKSFFPEEYQMGKNIVFVNDEGLEWVFMTEYKLTISQKQIGDHTYEAESINVGLYDHKNSGFRINLFAAASYSDDQSLINSISSSFQTPLGYFFTSPVIFRNGLPEQGWGADYASSVTWFSRTFEEVYQFRTGNNFSYSELYMNPVYGVVSFRDELDFLWVFDRFE